MIKGFLTGNYQIVMKAFLMLLALQKLIKAKDARIIQSRTSSGLPGPVINQATSGSSPTWIHLNMKDDALNSKGSISSIILDTDQFQTYTIPNLAPLFILAS